MNAPACWANLALICVRKASGSAPEANTPIGAGVTVGVAVGMGVFVGSGLAVAVGAERRLAACQRCRRPPAAPAAH